MVLASVISLTMAFFTPLMALTVSFSVIPGAGRTGAGGAIGRGAFVAAGGAGDGGCTDGSIRVGATAITIKDYHNMLIV